MSLIVKKFGGTSLGDTARIVMAAERVVEAMRRGHRVAVVVSAMAGETDRLIGLANAVGSKKLTAEVDTVATAGEQISAGLMALALQARGMKALSCLAWQVPITLSEGPVPQVATDFLQEKLDQDVIPIIAGYQAVGDDNRLVTLGRGGSDLTAIAVAGALGAERVDIYTDVPGVFTADPRIVRKAQRIPRLGMGQMVAFADGGAKVMDMNAVRLASQSGLAFEVRSSFEDCPGTRIEGNGDEVGPVVGIASKRLAKEKAQLTIVTGSKVASEDVICETRKIADLEKVSLHDVNKGDYNITVVVPHEGFENFLQKLHDHLVPAGVAVGGRKRG